MKRSSIFRVAIALFFSIIYVAIAIVMRTVYPAAAQLSSLRASNSATPAPEASPRIP